VIEEYLAHLRAMRKSDATVSGYAGDLEQFLAFLGPREPTGVDRNLARAYVQHLSEEELAGSTIRRKVAAVSSFYAWMVDTERIRVNPFSGLSLPKVEHRLPRFARAEEVEALIDALDDSALGLRNRAILDLLFSAGLRVGELASLRVGQVDLERREIRIIGKGNRERVAIFGEEGEASLRAYLTRGRPRLARGRGLSLFVNYRGGAMSDTAIQAMVGELSEAVLGRRLTPHAFRHGCATEMRNGGAQLADVALLLGHVDVRTTEIYDHIALDSLHRAYKESHPRARTADPLRFVSNSIEDIA
jgi:integrase/recombinase XerC